MRFSTIVASLALPLAACAAPIRRQTPTVSPTDILVLQFAHVLELLEADFYQQALDKFDDNDFLQAGISIPDVARQNFQGILEHELAHAAFLEEALSAVGGRPVEGCVFNFDPVLTDVATMAVVARVVEAVGVGAYAGASILVEDKNILLAAATILTIEARHQSVLNTINGATSVPSAFDIALTPPQVLALAGSFISGCSFPEIQANTPLAITNDGVVQPGTRLTFDFDGLAQVDPSTLSCQMVVGGQATALSFPIQDCVVPEGINGPVAIFITQDPQPLATDLTIQNADAIVAGPTIAFIDTIPDALGALVRVDSPPVQSSEEISQDQAQLELTNPVNGVPSAGGVPPALAPPSSAVIPPAAGPTVPATPENAASGPAAPPIRVIGEHFIDA